LVEIPGGRLRPHRIDEARVVRIGLFDIPARQPEHALPRIPLQVEHAQGEFGGGLGQLLRMGRPRQLGIEQWHHDAQRVEGRLGGFVNRPEGAMRRNRRHRAPVGCHDSFSLIAL